MHVWPPCSSNNVTQGDPQLHITVKDALRTISSTDVWKPHSFRVAQRNLVADFVYDGPIETTALMHRFAYVTLQTYLNSNYQRNCRKLFRNGSN